MYYIFCPIAYGNRLKYKKNHLDFQAFGLKADHPGSTKEKQFMTSKKNMCNRQLTKCHIKQKDPVVLLKSNIRLVIAISYKIYTKKKLRQMRS